METGASVDVQPGNEGSYPDSGPIQDPANIDPTSVQPQEAGNGDEQLGPSSLPPELEETRKQLLRDYHSKTQKLAEERGRYLTEKESLAQKAGILDQLMQKQWFQKASQEEQARLQGGGTQFDISDEEYQQAVTNKEAFKALVLKMNQQMLNGQVGPAIGAQNEVLQDLKVNQELDQALNVHPEIQDLIDNDDPEFYQYLDQGFDYATAYEKYAFRNQSRGTPTENEPSQEEVLNQSRAGSIARSGLPQTRGNRIIEARNLDEAMDQAFEALSRGEKDFVIQKPRK